MRRTVNKLAKLNWGRQAYVILVLCATTATALSAQTSNTLYVSGTLTDGAVLGGTMTVDEAAGTVTAFSFTIGAPDSLTTSVLEYDGAITQGANTFWLFQTGVAPGPYPSLSIVLPTSTLVGYTGGAFCSISVPCDGLVSGLIPAEGVQGPYLQSGIASQFTILHSFDGTDGEQPIGALVQATNGDLYGTTVYGGAKGAGTVFQTTPTGTLTTLHSFCAKSECTDGDYPFAGLVQATNGDLYGTTCGSSCVSGGNGFGHGTVFKMSPDGALKTLYSFCSQNGCADGSDPTATLVQATNGDFYGITENGGAANEGTPEGTIFKITPQGVLTTLYSFCFPYAYPNCTGGANPQGALVQATNGDLYGTASGGGANGYGTIFKMTPNGKLTILYNFCSQGTPPSDCTDGKGPTGGLVQATDGDLYGTTTGGGTYNGGTVFKITPTPPYTLTTLYSFCSQSGCPDGNNPSAALIQGTDGHLYGTTNNGGAGSNGTVFQITPGGTLTTLCSFCSQSGCADGRFSQAGLVQATNGDFYGVTTAGGTDNVGTVFSLSVGLGPFVETVPTSGKVGAAVTILGTNLIDATSVTFNGTAAAFTVNGSGTAITTTVPAGATTGTIEVVTPGGTLSSNLPFRVP
jgi:uncharacterized repeat protein (TIGR03803 family)